MCLQDLITIIVSIATFVVAFSQFVIARKKRRDDLFILRYNFYKRICKYWVSTNDRERDSAKYDELMYFSEEASFLFGDDVKKHINDQENKRNSNPEFVDECFTKPFIKYLKL